MNAERRTNPEPTQLYFPGEPRNATDGIYSAELLMTITTQDGVQNGAFDFLLRV